MKKMSNIIVQASNSGITRIKLNNPSTYNSLSTDMMKELIKSFENLHDDEKTRVIIIEGEGKGFCAGHNLKEINSLKGKPEYLKLFTLCSDLMMKIINNNKPVIAKIHGSAYAAGCQLVATCDLALSTNDAIFATPGVNIGLFCSTPMVAVSRNVSRKKTMKMLLTGESVSSKHAKEIGLINDYFEQSKLEEEVVKIAEVIASKSKKVLKIGKKAFYKQLELTTEEAYKYTSKIMCENMMTLDAKEGISAFLEKRNPNWSDK
tara:strand:+ start:30804 stop:31589 length:786 start_codon:yes stop_codon:yes gene_type:complete